MEEMNVVLSVSDGVVLVEVVHPDDVCGGEYGWRVSLVDGVVLMTSTKVYTVSLDALRAGLDWWLR
jgi:hypothetical protein